MAKFCANCGASMADEARFCGECGTPVAEMDPGMVDPVSEVCGAAAAEEIAQPEIPAEAASVTEEIPAAEAPAEPFVPQQPMMPREKKPMPKWLLPVGIAAVAVVVALVGVSMILKSLNGPEKIADKFVEALEAGDFEKLSKVAMPVDEDVEFTAETAAPMFKLYDESAKFRKTVENILDEDVELIEDDDDPEEGNIVDLVAHKGFLHTGYRVAIETCDASISSNMLCDVTLDGGMSVKIEQEDSYGDEAFSDVMYSEDYQYCTSGTAAVYDLLPGRYTMSGTVNTSFGDAFTAEADLDLMDCYDNYGELWFDYGTLELYNDSSVDVEVSIGGSVYCTMPAYSTCYVAPIQYETEVTAKALVDSDEPMEQTFTADSCGGYMTLNFVLCELEIYNGYGLTQYVYCDGELAAEIAPDDYVILEGLVGGTEIEVLLADDAELADPYFYICEDEYGYIYPEFVLSDDVSETIDAVIYEYSELAFELFNAQDMEGLQSLPQSELSSILISDLEYNQEYTVADDGYTRVCNLTLDGVERRSSYFGEGDAMVVQEHDVGFINNATYTMEDGSTETDQWDGTLSSVRYHLGLVDGQWTVITDPNA